MRVVHSLLHPDDLAELVEREYDVPGPVRVRLLRRGFNDTYVVADSTGERRALRVYTRDKYWIRSMSDVQFELELLEHLATDGHELRRSPESAGRVHPPGHLLCCVKPSRYSLPPYPVHCRFDGTQGHGKIGLCLW